MNDDVCFLDDNGGCNSGRLKNIFECGYLGCLEKTKANYDWMDSGQDTAHGTGVVALIAADYTQDQADGFDVCDPDCTSSSCSHSSNDFEERASAVAKETNIDYYDLLGTTNQSYFGNAAICAQGIGPGCAEADLINNSNTFGSGCSADSSMFVEDVMENAYDDGILIVSGSGNESTTGTTCNVQSPADTPKVLAINGIDLRTSDYDVAPPHATQAALGGGPIQSPNGTTRPKALSYSDLAAPSDGILYSTASNTADPDDPERGCVFTSTAAFGTSAATPIAASAALSLKTQLLDSGDVGVDYPGRLHTMMLLMGDRAKTGGGYRTGGTDDIFGFGRLKLRLVESGAPSSSPGSIERGTMTFVSGTADLKYIAFNGNPVPNGAEMVKCVMFQEEDMSAGHDDIGRFRLIMRVRGTSGGQCAIGAGTKYAVRINGDSDSKKMVAFQDSSVNIEGRCIEVEIDKKSVNSTGSTPVHFACGYFSELDNEPN